MLNFVGITEAGTYQYAEDISQLKVGTEYVMVTVVGTIGRSLRAQEASNSEIIIDGDVTGGVKISDSSLTDVEILGDVSGFFDGWNLIDVTFDAQSAGGARIRSSSNIEYSVGNIESFIAWDSQELDVSLGAAQYVSWDSVLASTLDILHADRVVVSGNQNTVSIQTLSSVVMEGNANDLDIGRLLKKFHVENGSNNHISVLGNAKGIIGEGTIGTTVTVSSGNFRIKDYGRDSNVNLGAGNDTVVSDGSGFATYNGGEGYNRITVKGGVFAVVDNFSVVKLKGFEGGLFFNDVPTDEFQFYRGKRKLDLLEKMEKDGFANGDDATLVLSSGVRIVFLDAADEIFPTPQSRASFAEDFLQPPDSFYDELLVA